MFTLWHSIVPILFVVAVVATVGTYFLPVSEASEPPKVGSYIGVTPTRLYDSRTVGNKRPLVAGSERTIKVVGGKGVPVAGVSAVMLNITVVSGVSSGSLTAYAGDSQRPANGSLFFYKSKAISNQVLVPVSLDGTIKLFPTAAVHAVIDVHGWVGADGSNVAPDNIAVFDAYEVLDTRSNSAKLTKDKSLTFKLAGVGPIPSNASAVIVNVTTHGPKNSGNVRLTPTGEAAYLPVALNVANQRISNQVIVPLNSTGTIDISTTSISGDVTVDVQGYFVAGTVTNTSKRLIDTRQTRPNKPLNASEAFAVKVGGSNGVPVDASTVTVNVTVIPGDKAGNMSVMPLGGLPAAYSQVIDSTVRANAMVFKPKTILAHTVTVPVGPNGFIVVKPSVPGAHVVVDMLDWMPAPRLDVVKPIEVARQRPSTQQADSVLAADILRSANKYAMTTWWNGEGRRLLTLPLHDVQSSDRADPVRRLSMESFSMATALSTGVYDPAVTGVSTDVARQRTMQMIAYIADRHVSNRAGGWGGGWQGSLWSGYAGRAGWLMWDSLPMSTQKAVAKMIYLEANDAAGKDINYLRDARGAYLNGTGDSGAEDTAWWAMPMQLASVMFPSNPRQPVWKQASVQFAIAAWSRPSDVRNGTIVNGRSVADWISGSNVEENGVLYNHNRVAPDYMTNMYQTMDDVWVSALGGSPTPKAATAQIKPVYDAYTQVRFAKGTLYSPESAVIYYPDGIDWGSGQQLPYALVDIQAEVYGATADIARAKKYKDFHMQAARNMQLRFNDGRSYANDAELNYVGREEHVSQIAAQLYLVTFVRDHGIISFTDRNYVIGEGDTTLNSKVVDEPGDTSPNANYSTGWELE